MEVKNSQDQLITKSLDLKCSWGYVLDKGSSPKVIDFNKANFEGKQNAPGIFAWNPVMNGKSTPHK